MFNPRTRETITSATLMDMANIDRIEKAAFATPWSVGLIRAAIHNKQYDVRVMRTEDTPVAGFYIAHVARDKSNLDNLAVHESIRGRGHGSSLIEDWIARANGRRAAGLALQVNTQNVRAQKLYKDFGFRMIRLLVAYYPNGDDAYLMERALAPRRTPAAH